MGCLDTRAVVVGHDFHFGYKRRGNVALLQDMGAEFGFDVTGLRLFPDEPGGHRCRRPGSASCWPPGPSARRRPCSAGRIEVRGVVTRGDRRGRELGFPTANVALPPVSPCPPTGSTPAGICAGRRPPAGRPVTRERPTFYEEPSLSLLEAYLLDFEGDLYGEPARVEFVAHLRGQTRFGTIEDLIDQMPRDVDATRLVLGGSEPA